jgi:hypothetical protein
MFYVLFARARRACPSVSEGPACQVRMPLPNPKSTCESLDKQADVLPAESEAIGQDDVTFGLARGVGDIVEVALGIGKFVIDRRRQDTIANGQQADDQFRRTCSGDEMPHHTLSAGDRKFIGVIAEDFFDGQRFDLIIDRRTGPMGIDIINVFGIQTGITEGHLHATDGATTFRMGVRDTVGIGGRSVTNNLAINPCSTAFGVFKFLQNHHPRTFTQDETVAITVERPGRLLRRVVLRTQGGQQAEARHTKRMNHGMRSAGRA